MKKEEYSLVYKAIHGDSHAYGELIHQCITHTFIK